MVLILCEFLCLFRYSQQVLSSTNVLWVHEYGGVAQSKQYFKQGNCFLREAPQHNTSNMRTFFRVRLHTGRCITDMLSTFLATRNSIRGARGVSGLCL